MRAATVAELELLKTWGSATTHEALGARGAMDAGIKPVDPNRRLAGHAFTVDCTPGDNLLLHYALTRISAGQVLVAGAKGAIDTGLWGDLMTLAAHTRGCAGLVIDGAVRDADAILDIGFPVFTRALCIKGTTKRHGGRVEVAIECGGTRVEPGDIIVGDRDGIVVIPLRDLDEVLNVARARIEKEEWVRSEIRKGRSTVELLGLESIVRSAGLE